MDEHTKKKMCWNCEGNVSLHEDKCPYCCAAIIPLEKEGDLEPNSEGENATYDEGITVAMTMTLLMGGCFFFLFSTLLYFFSDKGFLTLRWSNSYWYIYMFLSFAMLYFGFRYFQQLSDEK